MFVLKVIINYKCILTWVVALLTKAPTFLVKVVSKASEGDTVFTSLPQTHTRNQNWLNWQIKKKSVLNRISSHSYLLQDVGGASWGDCPVGHDGTRPCSAAVPWLGWAGTCGTPPSLPGTTIWLGRETHTWPPRSGHSDTQTYTHTILKTGASNSQQLVNIREDERHEVRTERVGPLHVCGPYLVRMCSSSTSRRMAQIHSSQGRSLIWQTRAVQLRERVRFMSQ